MKRIILSLSLAALFCMNVCAQTEEPESAEPSFYPVSMVFYDIGWNTLHSFTYNYGLNFIAAGLETVGFIATGADWYWRNVAYNSDWLPRAGSVSLWVGLFVPVILPIGTYVAGRNKNNVKLQIAGLAMMQATVLTTVIQSSLKMVTGRALPGITTELDDVRDPRTEDFSGEFDWFNMNFLGGWPSGHTANAIAAAVAISEIYKDNLWLKIGMYSYAALIGMGMTVNGHWASEVFAGALIGYAVGKTVGKSFSKLLDNSVTDDKVSVYVMPNTIGVKIRF